MKVNRVWIGIMMLTTVWATLSSTNRAFSCNSRLLQYYGFEGLAHSISYSILDQVNADKMCPNLDQSCCSPEDFYNSSKMWATHSDRIKGYLTQIFRTLQKVASIQSSLIQFMPKIMSKNTKACRNIEATFFNSPIQFDEVYFYIRNALEGFAYIQKGFYCMICDPRQHPFVQMRSNYGRLFVQMNEKTCDDIIFFFREFLVYRVYFFNPLVKAFNQVLNCVHDTDIQRFNFESFVTFQAVEECLKHKTYCQRVCNQFRIGTSSNLFIGQLNEYKLLMKEMEQLISEMSESSPQFNELDFLDEDFSGEFFARPDDSLISSNMQLLKDYNLSRAEMVFTKGVGVSLFDIAVESNYFLTDASTLGVVKENYDLMSGTNNRANVLDADANPPDAEFEQAPDIKTNQFNQDELKRQEIIAGAPPGVNVESLSVQIEQQTVQGSGGVPPSAGTKVAPEGAEEELTNIADLEKEYLKSMKEANPDEPQTTEPKTAAIANKAAGTLSYLKSYF